MRLTFYKPMHDFLTGNTFSGNYELHSRGVLVLDEHPVPPGWQTEAQEPQQPIQA